MTDKQPEVPSPLSSLPDEMDAASTISLSAPGDWNQQIMAPIPTEPLAGLPRLPVGWRYINPIPTSIEALIATLMGLTRPYWLFRGESRHFHTHRPSLTRKWPANVEVTPIECGLIHRFMSHSHDILTASERALVDNIFGWLILMQHHGAPTRLLDWSHSCWVAAYHACTRDLDHDAYLWTFNPGPVTDHVSARLTPSDDIVAARSLDEYHDRCKTAGRFIVCCGATQMTARMVAQQSTYTVANPEPSDHMEMIGEHLKSKMLGEVLIIPSELKGRMMHTLFQMNLTASTLFPGIDGVGRLVGEIVEHRIRIPDIHINFAQQYGRIGLASPPQSEPQEPIERPGEPPSS